MAAAELARRGFVRRAAKAVLALALLFVANAAYGEGIPRLGDIPTTMDPVQVALWPNLRSKSTAEPWVQFEIPRAYIYLTSHHSQKQYVELPSAIEAETIGIMPLSNDIRNWTPHCLTLNVTG